MSGRPFLSLLKPQNRGPVGKIEADVRGGNTIQNGRFLLITVGKMVRLEEFSLQERTRSQFDRETPALVGRKFCCRVNFPSDLLAIRWAATQEYIALEHYPFFCSLLFSCA